MNPYLNQLKKLPHAVYLFTGILVLFAILSPHFLSMTNLTNMVLQGSVLLIVSLGMTLVMLSNGIDLSVGALMSLTGMIAGIPLSKEFGLIPALFIGILMGLLAGLLIGFLVARLDFPPFIATFGMMGIFEGTSLFMNKGESIYWKESVLTSSETVTFFRFPFLSGWPPRSFSLSIFSFIKPPSGSMSLPSVDMRRD